MAPKRIVKLPNWLIELLRHFDISIDFQQPQLFADNPFGFEYLTKMYKKTLISYHPQQI